MTTVAGTFTAVLSAQKEDERKRGRDVNMPHTDVFNSVVSRGYSERKGTQNRSNFHLLFHVLAHLAAMLTLQLAL